MNSNFKNAKTGDWACDRKGWGKIKIANSYCGPYQVELNDTPYTIGGMLDVEDIHPSAYIVPPEGWKACDKPMQRFKKGDRVLVGKSKLRRYFSHYGWKGEAHCFYNGQDEWTAKGKTTKWGTIIPAD